MTKYWRWYPVIALLMLALIPIVPTGWITRTDTKPDASSSFTPAAVTPPVPIIKKGPRPFAKGDRVKLNAFNTSFGIPPGATGTINHDWKKGSCRDGYYGVSFDNFPAEEGYSGFCIYAWMIELY